MSREIKFRGWSLTDNKWVYGSLNSYDDGKCIITNSKGSQSWFVAPESVGQFTGLKDKSGKEIYEGDRIRYANSMEHGEGTIGFSAGFLIEWDLSTVKTEHPMIMQPLFYFQCSAELEIIWNVHELLKGGDNNG